MDVTLPVADMGTLADVTGECSATVSTMPTATDNCSGSITGTTTDALTYNTQGTHTITWTYDDGNGNSSTQTQNVVIMDVTAPVVNFVSNTIGTSTDGTSGDCMFADNFGPAGVQILSDNC